MLRTFKNCPIWSHWSQNTVYISLLNLLTRPKIAQMRPAITFPQNLTISVVTPVTSYWAEWSSWSNCTFLCNTGTQQRTRACQLPQLGPCLGAAFDEQDCNTISCAQFYAGTTFIRFGSMLRVITRISVQCPHLWLILLAL